TAYSPPDVKKITKAFEQIPGVRALTANIQTITALATAEVERMVSTLNEMEGVSILARYDGGHVTVEGSVFSPSDIEKITKALEQIRGVQTVTASVRPEQLIHSTRIYFDFASSQLKPLETDKILKIKEFLTQYPNVNLKLIGHTDPTGGVEENRQLSIGRAEVVRAALVVQGVETSRLQIEGIPEPPADIDVTQSVSLGRCVRFEFVEATSQTR
ncbi:MAG: OmpA family protein, partial [Nitrospira sp.]|nr:OmpA family protein [Nitrospira sp.]